MDLKDLFGDSFGSPWGAWLAVEACRQKYRIGCAGAVRCRDLKVICELLDRQNLDILVDWRPKAGVRFSPHFYNTDAEVDRAITAVAEILKDRAVTSRD